MPEKSTRPLCIHCGTRIRDFRTTRDYATRPAHKKCFLENLRNQEFIDKMERRNSY